MSKLCWPVIAMFLAGSAGAQQLQVERFEGPSLEVPLDTRVVLNAGSTLYREWIVLSDPKSPARLIGRAGVEVKWEVPDSRTPGRYVYRASYTVAAQEPIRAVEVRAAVVDVFGRVYTTLSSVDVADVNTERGFSSSWRVLRETDAARAYGSVLYVAAVRTAGGRVYTADPRAIASAVRQVWSSVSESDLAPLTGAAKE